MSDAFSDAAETLAKETGARVSDAEGIFADDTIDAVIIGTPTDSHASYIEAAALAGKRWERLLIATADFSFGSKPDQTAGSI